MSDDDPLDTSMSAHQGKPEAVALLLRQAAGMMDDMPNDMQLNVELDVWETGARGERNE